MNKEISTCVICLDDINDDDKTTKLHTCDHVVHTACFLTYVNHTLNGVASQVTCPICRRVTIDISNRPRQILMVPPPPSRLNIQIPQPIPQENLQTRDQETQSRLRCLTLFIYAVLFGNFMYFLYILAADNGHN